MLYGVLLPRFCTAMRCKPTKSVREARLGEYAHYRDRLPRARRWMIEQPTRFRDLTLRRNREFWFPTSGKSSVYEYSRWLITGFR